MTRINLQVSGMHCNSCEELIRDILSDISVRMVSASHKSGKVEIEIDQKKVQMERVKKAIETEGDNYKVVSWTA